jgi:DNA-binding transcriptional LysR family regulator
MIGYGYNLNLIGGRMRWDARIGRRLKLHDLHVLLAVVEAGSMAKAAARLAVSQPAVSKAIADMERALSVRILDRGPQGVEPTRYGRALVRRGAAVFDELKQGVKEIEFLADPTVGELRIGTTEPLAASFVSAVVERLTRQYPRIIFHVLQGHTATLYHDLRERDVEFVITRTFEPPPEEHMQVENLFDDIHVVAAGGKNRWHRRRGVRLADLAGEPWVLPPLDSLHGTLIAQAFRLAGLKVPAAAVFTFSFALRERLVGAGPFLTTAPSFLVRDGHPWLRALPIELAATRSPIAIVTLKNRTLGPVAELFLDHVRAVAKEFATET